MVSLSTAYGLCTLIDQGGFLHVSEDENDCYIVTLGRNIVIRYRLTDQKQLNSWSTIPQLSSKVVYNPEKRQYIGIFNENVIKQWSEDDNSLDKASKIKLKDPGHEILIDEEPLLLFKSGACCKLAYLENKDFTSLNGVLPANSKISLSKIFNSENGKFLGLIASNSEKYSLLYTIALNPETLIPGVSSLKTLKLRRRGHTLLGSCFVTQENGCSLVTLWSDGFLYSLSLPLGQPNTEMHLGQFMGVVRNVSLSSPVALASLSGHHLAIYGGDPSEEGAVLAVYNLVFGMVQASTSFKLLQKPPRVWAIHGRLLVGLGQRLVCVPYSLQTDCVAALVGTRPPGTETQTSDITTVLPIVLWGDGSAADQSPKNKKAITAPSDLNATLDELAAQGISETRTCEVLISQSIDQENIEKLSWCLENFLYIPEHLIVKLLNFTFTASDTIFTLNNSSKPEEMPLVNGKSKKSDNKELDDVLTLIGEIKHDIDHVHIETNPLSSIERSIFVDRVLKIPCNSSSLVPALRNGFSIDNCILFLRYLSYLMSGGKIELEMTVFWATSLIDAFYQQLVLGRHTECIESVLHLQNQVDEKIIILNELKEILPYIDRISTSKGISKSPVQSKNYSIQKIQIYD